MFYQLIYCVSVKKNNSDVSAISLFFLVKKIGGIQFKRSKKYLNYGQRTSVRPVTKRVPQYCDTFTIRCLHRLRNISLCPSQPLHVNYLRLLVLMDMIRKTNQ